jgi:hypothetical protein
VVAHACNLTTREAEIEKSKFEASQGKKKLGRVSVLFASQDKNLKTLSEK